MDDDDARTAPQPCMDKDMEDGTHAHFASNLYFYFEIRS